MRDSNIYNAIRIKIREGETAETINSLRELLNENKLRKLILRLNIIEAHYHDNEDQFQKGIITVNEYNLNLNRTRNSILKVVDEVENRNQKKDNSLYKNQSKYLFEDSKRKQTARIYLIIFSTIILISFLLENVIGPKYSQLFINNKLFGQILYSNNWITYEPKNFHPHSDSIKQLNIDTIKHELNEIRRAGFTGIITFSSTGKMAKIPELAKKMNLKVIMGIHNPNDLSELEIARKNKSFVEGYFLGHCNWPKRYSIDELRKKIQQLRFRTGKPVSTLEQFNSFKHNKEFVEITDWVFGDAHLSLRVRDSSEYNFKINPISDAEKTIKFSNDIAKIESLDEKPILLMLAYPMYGITAASLQSQADYFRTIFDYMKDSHNPINPYIQFVVHNSFDSPWKDENNYHAWSKYTGLFDKNNRTRPAVEIITRKFKKPD